MRRLSRTRGAPRETSDGYWEGDGLESDDGSRYLGEFAIGTNFDINKFTGNILFDEKIGGSFHLALGAGYPETGSKNKSAIHWDLICDVRRDSEIRVDGQLFYKDGDFVFQK